MSASRREPDLASSSSDDDSYSDEGPASTLETSTEDREVRERDGTSSSEEEEEDSDASSSADGSQLKNESSRRKTVDGRPGDDKWSDEEDSEVEESNENVSNPDERYQALSLQERLQHQEDRQSSRTTTSALKHRRDRRNRAIPIAKERLQAFKKKQQQERSSNTASGDESDDSNNDRKSGRKRKSKHAPTEVSSRRKSRYSNRSLNESGIGVQIGSNRYQPRDPRMSSLSGHLDEQQFEKNYGFLDEMQGNEIDKLKRKLKALQKTGQRGRRERKKLGVTLDDTAESLQERLQKMQTAVARRNQERLERKTKKAVKQKIHAQVAEGKGGMYFPKRQEMKRLHLEAKVEEIKKQSGKHGLDKYLAKKRKKQKSIHAKKMRSAGAGVVGERSSSGQEE